MTTRNFRVHNGISVGDIVISASANTITGMTTSAPSSDGDVSNKKYVDDQDAAIASDTLTFTNKTIDANGTGNSISNIEVADFAGAAIINVSETLASNDSDTALVTAGAIIDYVDAQDANIASDTLTFTNKTLDANGTGNSLTNIDSGNMLSGFFLDEDNMASNSATSIASQQSIKAYVDTEIGNISTAAISAGNSSATISDSGSDGALTVVCDGNTELVVNDTAATFSGNVVVTGNFTVNGTTTTVATTNTTNTDNIYELATGTTGSPANDAGLIIERGDSANAFIGFDESEDKFKVGTTSSTGSATGNLTITTGTLIANIEGNVTGNLTGTATAAQYSDVAERFASDEAMAPGTVVALGGAEEITQVNEEGSDEVFGVVSSLDQAAFKMNGGAGNDETHPYIAMTGRVNVKVIGTVNKGDRLISASVPGYARAATKAECTAFNVIGRALTSKTEAGQGSVLAAVRVSH